MSTPLWRWGPLATAAAVALVLTIVSFGALDEADALREELVVIRASLAQQQEDLYARATLAELREQSQGLQAQLQATRAEIAELRARALAASEEARMVLEKYVTKPSGAVGPPTILYIRGGVAMPLYVDLCARYTRSGSEGESCLASSTYSIDAIFDCFARAEVGRPLPGCFP